MAVTLNANTSTGFIATSDTSGVLQLQTGGTTAVTITTAQNVGIGTSSPTAKLHVSGDAIANTFKLIANTTVSGSDATIFRPADNTLAFSTNGAERARIDSSGNLLVGKTAQSPTTAGIEFVSPTVSGSGITVTSAQSTNLYSGFQMYSTGAAAYRFYVTFDGKINATNTTIAGISDQRLKENIRDLDDGLNTVMALKPRKFDWKEGKGADIKDARGFIAQEFEEVFPDLIDEWRDPAPEGEDPYKSVRADLIPVLVKAIQEQQAIITSLTDRITALENK